MKQVTVLVTCVLDNERGVKTIWQELNTVQTTKLMWPHIQKWPRTPSTQGRTCLLTTHPFIDSQLSICMNIQGAQALDCK